MPWRFSVKNTWPSARTTPAVPNGRRFASHSGCAPVVGCAKGVLHGANFVLDNEKWPMKKSPEVLAMTIIDLLYDDAKKAEEICANFKPVFTKETYCEFQDKIASGQ